MEDCHDNSTRLGPAMEGLAQLTTCDRAIFWLFDREKNELVVQSEYHEPKLKPLSGTRINCSIQEGEQETYFLARKHWLFPEKTEKNTPPYLPTLEKAFTEIDAQKSVLFPGKLHERLHCLISLHRCNNADEFLAENLELAEALSQEILAELATRTHIGAFKPSSSGLTRDLVYERTARHLVSKVHVSLDKDIILQTSVDALGHALKASACLIVSFDGATPPLVTHEYVEPSISPLGLGGTAMISSSIIAHFAERTNTMIESSFGKYEDTVPIYELEQLLKSGARSLLGTPIAANEHNYGILIVQSNELRQWQSHEIMLTEATAAELVRALNNAQAYQQLKEQVFNLKLLNSISQQLSKALEQSTSRGSEDNHNESAERHAAKVPLSTRELEVLRLIASGLSNKDIAQKLFLTESTVELHASRIRKKLKIKTRTALVKFAYDNRLA